MHTEKHTAETHETGFCSSFAQQSERRMWNFRFNAKDATFHNRHHADKNTDKKHSESQLKCYDRNDKKDD